jgi:hypothetical protein
MRKSLQAAGNIQLLKYFLALALFPVFFILHGYNENFGLIPWPVMGGLFVKYLAIMLGIFIISYLLFKSVLKSFVFSFYCLAVYFFFGFLHDLVHSFFQESFFASYKFLLPIILVVSAALFFWMQRSNKSFRRPARFVAYLLVLFVAFEIISVGFNVFRNRSAENNLAIPASENETNAPCVNGKPDIFFIVLDEYASTKGLKKYFDYDNSLMDSFFIQNGFYISGGSKSNYNFTPFSLASTFHYDYLSLSEADSLFSNTRLLQGIESFRKNRLTTFLHKQGYELLNFGCFELEQTRLETYADFEWLPGNMIDKQTLSSRIRDDIGWQLRTKNIFSGEFKIPKSYWQKKKRHLHRNDYNLIHLKQELKTAGNKPRFVYAHLMLPHEPYYLDASGNPVSDTAVYLNAIKPEKGYFEQLIYCNKILRELISLAVMETGRERVIIIEGDHGIRFHHAGTSKEMEFDNLNAYYFSDKDYQMLYDTISPVNTFRVILNKYFCGNLPLLKDSSFYMKQKGRY